MADTLPHLPACTYAPPLRCGHRDESPERQVCGAVAMRFRPGPNWFTPEYFCQDHSRAEDLGIPTAHIFRRVRVTVDVLFAGTSMEGPAAHAEAVARLERAVTAAGGLLEVDRVRSAMVKSMPLQPAQQAIDAAGKG